MAKSEDPNLSAHAVLAEIMARDDDRLKNPAAVALGRLGGLKGGKARAAKLTATRRSEIARKAGSAPKRQRRG